MSAPKRLSLGEHRARRKTIEARRVAELTALPTAAKLERLRLLVPEAADAFDLILTEALIHTWIGKFWTPKKGGGA